MKIVLARLKIVTLNVRITVLIMIMMRVQMKYGWMGIGFIRQPIVMVIMVNMVNLTMEENVHKDHDQTTLCNG